MYKKLIILLVVASLFSACATTEKAKITQAIITGASIGALYGLTRKEMKDENAMMFASQGAAIGAIAAVLINDSDEKIKTLEAKVKFLDESTTKQTSPNFEEIPEEYKALLESQNYEMYRINRWTKKGHYLVNESALIDLKEKR
jgi:hypothetical protein